MLARSWENGGGQTLLTGCTPAFQTAESADCPFTASFGTLLFGQTGLLKFLFPNPGEWQMTVETEDERIIGKTTFLVESDDRVFRRVETLVY